MLFVELSSRKELLREDFRRFNKDFPRFDQLLPENNSLPPHQGLLLIPEKWQKNIFSELPSLKSSLTLAAQAKPSLLSHPAPTSTLW